MSSNRSQRGGTASGRDRRMFASIQSALGGPSPQGPRTRARARANEEKAEKLDDVDQVIAQISNLSIRGDRSAMQIKKNIVSCNYLEEMDDEEWDKLCKALFHSALHENETDFVVDLFGSLLVHPVFCEVICIEIAQTSATYIMEGNDDDTVPTFLGAILCGNWPRGATRATESNNPILYTALSIVKGWLIVLNDSEKESLKSSSNTMKRDFDDLEDDEDDEDDEDEEKNDVEASQEEKEEQASPEVVERCAKAVAMLCRSAQRSLWMKWPTLCDEIYSAIKPAITHSKVLTGGTKADLLTTLLLLHKWTSTKEVNTKSSYTQTVSS
ncbi:unnamed protein product, partial [Mesorhabditis belari]|uniref:DUF7627 domain-containing protein n=1 Tax=Mesorhabditis belari TaxID=2138241 RepID=A0AAF3E8L7_9BILA